MKRLAATLATFLLGSIVTLVFIQVTSAHGGDTSLIHGCVGTGVLNQGRLRIISASGSCNANETPLDWRSYDTSTAPPFVCIGCSMSESQGFHVGADRLKGKNLRNSYLMGSNFAGSQISLENTDLTNTYASTTNWDSTNLTAANFTNGFLQSSDFNNAIIINANFTGADLSFAQNMSTTTRTGVIWSNTICPDGTNSNSHGNTCEGHL